MPQALRYPVSDAAEELAGPWDRVPSCLFRASFGAVSSAQVLISASDCLISGHFTVFVSLLLPT